MRLTLSLITLLGLLVAGVLAPPTPETPRTLKVRASKSLPVENAAVLQSGVQLWQISHAVSGERYTSEISDEQAIEIALRRGEESKSERAVGRSLQVRNEDAEVATAPVSAAEVENAAGFTPYERIWRVIADRVNLRSGPGTENPVVGRADRGDALVPLSGIGEAWIEVRRPSGETAWIFTDFLSDVEDQG